MTDGTPNLRKPNVLGIPFFGANIVTSYDGRGSYETREPPNILEIPFTFAYDRGSVLLQSISFLADGASPTLRDETQCCWNPIHSCFTIVCVALFAKI